MTKTIKCPRCDGAGKVGSDWLPVGEHTCPACEGKGRVPGEAPPPLKKPRVKLAGGLKR